MEDRFGQAKRAPLTAGVRPLLHDKKMNIKHLLCVLAATLAVAGCGKKSTSSSDPLESFKVIATKCHAAIAASDRTVAGKNGGFIRTEITPGPKSFDVKKTESLVSPYVAYIEVNFIEKSMVASTEEDARNWNGNSINTVSHWRLVYAMQDEKWKLQEELYSFELPGANVAQNEPKPMKAGALAETIPAAIACNAP